MKQIIGADQPIRFSIIIRLIRARDATGDNPWELCYNTVLFYLMSSSQPMHELKNASPIGETLLITELCFTILHIKKVLNFETMPAQSRSGYTGIT